MTHAASAANAALAAQLNDALKRRDRDAIIALFAEDSEFVPSRLGRRAKGPEDVADTMLTWMSKYRPGAAFVAEREFYADDEGHCEWRFTATDLEGDPVEILGVDYFRFEGDRIAVKDSYIKV